jgi:predicted metal-dependent hydrolase
MENNQVDLDNLTKEDFMEMAKYVAHTEAQNRLLLEQLREAKAALMATVQQRNSLNAKVQALVHEKINTVDISAIKTEIVTNVELTNPEMYAVPKERLGLSEKSDRI